MEIDPRLRRLQLTELEILKEFVRICEEYGLRYYLVGGTLLGAVRHGGFIPWDDDIDVGMPREDYDRFAEIAPTALNKEYFYQCPDTDSDYFLSYAKLRKNGTEIYEERFKASRFHKGIFIDIFPLDFCPKRGVLCHLLFNTLAVMNYRGQVDSGEVYHPYKEWSGKVGYALLRLFSPTELVRVRRWLLRLSKRLSDGKHIASYSGAYGYRKEVFGVECFTPNSIVFEKNNYFCPNAQMLLAQIYGENFMEMPKKEEQRCHINVKNIKFIERGKENEYCVN